MFYFTADQIVQQRGSIEQRWTVSELLEAFDPLPDEPLGERHAALQKAVEMALQAPETLSERARLHLNFWTNLQTRNIPERTYVYQAGERWELSISPLGLVYRDVAQQYNSLNRGITEQLFSDFWFFGPDCPIPGLALRTELVNIIRSALADPDGAAAQAHFPLFEYPQKSIENLFWEEGNHVRHDWFRVIPHGLEMGHSTFRDGPSGPGYLSFEHFLRVPPPRYDWIAPEIRWAVEEYLNQSSPFSPPKPLEDIYRPPTPRELLDRSDALLKQDPDSREGAEMLLSLLPFETETDYWRNYVFNRCGHLRTNPVVQQFVLEQLQGDQELRFKKAVDVLMAWCMFSNQLPRYRDLLLRLNWDDATANDPAFRDAMVEVRKMIGVYS